MKENLIPNSEISDPIFNLEDKIWSILDNLPDCHIKRTLSDRMLNEDDLDATELDRILKDLEKYIRGSFGSGRIDFGAVREENFFAVEDSDKEKILDFLNRLIASPDSFKGKGSTASVINHDKYSGICFKVINDLKEYQEGATVQTEAMFMSDLADTSVNGSRLPKVYYYLMSPECHVLAMETLPAIPLNKLLDGEQKLKAGFNLKKPFADLRALVMEIHRCGLTHNDIHEDNVMFDPATGVLYLIDFGKARRIFNDRVDSYSYTKDTAAYNDLVALKDLYQKIVAK